MDGGEGREPSCYSRRGLCPLGASAVRGLMPDGARRRGKSSPDAKQSAATVGGGGVELLVGWHDAASLLSSEWSFCTGVNIS